MIVKHDEEELREPAASRFPLELADRCVKCGLCLPHCPTYRMLGNEGDSPRGRIALMQGLATGQLGTTPALKAHLDRCLSCRSCERVCPADVPYGRLIDAAREELIRKGTAAGWATRISSGVLTRPWARRMAALALGMIRRSGLVRVASRWAPRRWRRVALRIPPGSRAWKPTAMPTIASPVHRVSLFAGCLSPLVDGRTLEDACNVLTAMRTQVVFAGEQQCCGGIDLHAGRSKRARHLARKNLSAFGADDSTVLGLASGCTATLTEYDQLVQGGEGLSRRTRDVMAWIAEHADELPRLELPTETACMVHYPCTQTNVLGDKDSLPRVLDRIGNLRWSALEADSVGGYCCGGAGTYMLSQPALADALAEELLGGPGAPETGLLISANVGCALHLQAVLRAQNRAVEVLHPVSLVAMSLPPNKS